MTDDEGVTLIELIIAIGILVIVMGAIASSMITGLKVTSETQQRISESREAQIASAYFTNDVQTAVTVTVWSPPPISAPDYGPCNGTAPTETPVVSLEGASHDTAGNVTGTVVSYVINGELPGSRKLERQRCTKPGATWQTDSERTVITSLSDAPNDDVTCEPSSDCLGPIQKVTVNLEVCGRTQADNCLFDPAQRFRFALIGSRRPT